MASLSYKLIFTVLGLLMANAASASQSASSLYKAGQYEMAVVEAEMAGGAENYVVAARSLNAIAYFEPDRKISRRAAKRAFKNARAALDIEPSNLNANLEAAVSLGLRSGKSSPVKVYLKRLPSRAKEHIDRALMIDPDDPYALSISATWHLEITHSGADDIYDADPELGYRQCANAYKAAPNNIVVAYECALHLLVFKKPEWRQEALAALNSAITSVPGTDFERQIQQRAYDFQKAIENGVVSERKYIDDRT